MRLPVDSILEARARAIAVKGPDMSKVGKPAGPNRVIHWDGFSRRICKRPSPQPDVALFRLDGES